MKALLAAALLAIAPVLFAEPLQVRANNGMLLKAGNATAAYTLDSTIADATLHNGEITLFGKTAGTTKLVLVTPAGERILDVIVTPAASAGIQTASVAAPRRAVVETRYSSGAAQITNTVEVITPGSNLRVMNVRYLQERYGSLSDAFPVVSWQFDSPGRTLTLFDKRVDNSPLTLDNATVRGVHLEQGGWNLHAGYTGAAFYDGVILPADRETVAGLSYSRQIAPAWRLMPSLYAYPSRHASDRSNRGAVASLLVAYSPNDRLHLFSELGVSRGVGASLQFDWMGGRNRVRADLRRTPRVFAIAGPNTIRGTYADVAWNAHAGRLTSDAAFSWNDYLLPHFQQRSITSSVDLRYRISQPFSLLGGARYSSFEGIAPQTQRVDSLIVPAGFALDFPHFGATAVARFGRNSADGNMRGFRVTGRASAGSFSATAYLDRQDDTPTLQLIFQQRPDLALALERLGFEAVTPDDIARILRDNASLLNLGIIEGASVNLAPRRDQAGLELAWTGSSAARQRLRLRVFTNHTESVRATTTSTLAMLSYARRLTPSTDIETSIARFSPGRTSVDVAVRHSFDGLPHLGGGDISGSVVLDETSAGIGGVDVQLDAGRTVKTDASGRYAFAGVGNGRHEVIARLPRADAYFTTPSRVAAGAGDVVDFGLAWGAARMAGRVVSDAGLGVGGVRVFITAGARRFDAVTDSDGNFAVAGPAGQWSSEIDAGSLPAGYTIPQAGALRLTAARTITGRVTGAANAEVEALPTGKRVTVDAEGRFAFRALPAGVITLVARAGSRSVTRTITLPPQPAAISDVELTIRPESARMSGSRTQPAGSPSRK